MTSSSHDIYFHTLSRNQSKLSHVKKYWLDSGELLQGEILHAYGDIAGHCGRFGTESDWLNLGEPMYRCRA